MADALLHVNGMFETPQGFGAIVPTERAEKRWRIGRP